MAVSFIAKGTAAAAAAASVNVVAPACNVGDILICQVLSKVLTTAITMPAGWTSKAQVNGDCTTAADDHRWAIFWKRAVSGDSGASFAVSRAGNTLIFAVISVYRGCVATGDPFDATAPASTLTVAANANIAFPAYDPVSTDGMVVLVGFYGNDLTNFTAGAISGTPTATKRGDDETATGTDGSICSADYVSTGAAAASRTWASGATANAGSTGVVFALVAAPAGVSGTGAPVLPRLTATGVGDVFIKGTAAPLLPKLASSGAGKIAVAGTGKTGLALPKLASTGAAKVLVLGTGKAGLALPKLGSVSAGAVRVLGTGAPTLPRLTALGAGGLLVPRIGAGLGVFPRLTAHGTGTVAVRGAATLTLPRLAATSTGVVMVKGAGKVGLALPLLTAFGSSSIPTRTGTGAPVLPRLSATATGVVSVVGAGALVLPLLQATGLGIVFVPAAPAMAVDYDAISLTTLQSATLTLDRIVDYATVSLT